MQADYSVELGAEDPTLSIPWASPDGSLRYHDLKSRPDLLLYVEEAGRYRELGEFLRRINNQRSLLQTAKCDVWFTTELNQEEQIFQARGKFGGYIDICFMKPETQRDFAAHESFARRLTALLARAPELPASLELVVRRAFFQVEAEVENGYYFTAYVFGYHAEEEEARRRWAVSLELLQNALLQLAGRSPGGV